MGGMLPSVAMSAMQIASNASQARAAAKQTDTQLSQENAQISQQADAQVRQAQQNQAIDQNDRSERLRRALRDADSPLRGAGHRRERRIG